MHGKESSQKRDWRSHLGIELDTSRIEGRAVTDCNNPSHQKLLKTQSSAVECLPDTVSIVFPKIEWYSSTSASWQDDLFFLAFPCSFFMMKKILKRPQRTPDATKIMINYVSHTRAFLIGAVMAYRKDPPWRISVRILSGSLSFSHFATSILNISNLREVRERTLCERNFYPLLFRVQSSRTGHEYKVTHTITHTLFQIDSWVKSLSASYRVIFAKKCVYYPKKFHCHV